MSQDRPFEIVDDLDGQSQSPSVNTEEFVQQALQDGYTRDIIDRAVKHVTPSITNYRQFETVAIEEAFKEIDDEQRYEEQKRARLAKSAQMALERIESIPNPNAHLESLIQQKYNTTAVTSMDLIQHCSTSSNLKLELYQKPVFSLIVQIDAPWVKESIDACMNKWKTDKYVRTYVGKYLRDKGITDTSKLLDLLPDVIRNENSPNEYKLFRAVQLARQQGASEEVVEMDAVSDDAFLCYNDTIDTTFKGNTPFLMAEIVATEEAIRSMSAVERKSLFTNASNVYGKAIRLKYQTAKSFDDAMRSSLGEYYEPWKASKDKRIAERAQKKEQRRQAAMQKRNAVEPPKTNAGKVDDNAKEYNKQSGKVGQNSKPEKQKEVVNIGPNYKDIPFPFIITGVHILLALILWLILGKVKAVMLLLCFVVASGGFFMLKKEKLKSSLAIALSYVLIFIIIIL